jgi:hypothetical protein
MERRWVGLDSIIVERRRRRVMLNRRIMIVRTTLS